jgi:hypothetical protein
MEHRLGQDLVVNSVSEVNVTGRDTTLSITHRWSAGGDERIVANECGHRHGGLLRSVQPYHRFVGTEVCGTDVCGTDVFPAGVRNTLADR